MFSLFSNYFSDRNSDIFSKMCGNYHTYIIEVIHYHHVVCTDVIIMYDIVNFYIEIVNWMI